MNVYSILDYNAKPNAENPQTAAIQACIDACYLNGGGTVEIPAGTFLTGGLRIRSNVTLFLRSGAVVAGSRNPMDYMAIREDSLEPLKYNDISDAPCATNGNRLNNDHINKPGSRWNNALLRAIDAENIAVIGEGDAVIDGMDPYDELGEEGYRGPHGMDFHRCKNVTLRGYTIRNTGNWAHAIFDSGNIVMEYVTVLAGHDGIHMTSCENVKLEACAFYTGDDCIAGFDNLNVTARMCAINTACSGLRFGGTNALIEDCRFFGPAKYLFRGSLTREEKKLGKPLANEGQHRHNMLSAFTYYADFTRDILREPGNIILRNCAFTNTDRFLHYNYSGNELWQRNRPLKSIRFENIVATGIRHPVTAYGDAALRVRLEIVNSELTFFPVKGMQCMSLCQWEDVVLKNVKIRGIEHDVLIKTWSDGPAVRMENVDMDGFSGKLMQKTDEPFVCEPI